MTGLVAVDIGGTHARFALASVEPCGTIALGEPETLRTSDYASLQTAWEEFERRAGTALPRAASVALAGPVNGGTVRLTNNSWTIRPATLAETLGLDQVTVLNDFAAVAHAVARAAPDQFSYIAGPDIPLPETGTISVIGPGTGLGVAYFNRRRGGSYTVQATEGGHIDFAPVDHVDDAILARLRRQLRRVSAERVVAGPGIVPIHATLAAMEGRAIVESDDRTLWTNGLEGKDSLAAAAVERFCMSLGSVAGDLALAHGASAVVIAGGLGYRIRRTLRASGFADRFRYKGRYEQIMAGIPVKVITHPQPGLFGAVAAFAAQHGVELWGEPSKPS